MPDGPVVNDPAAAGFFSRLPAHIAAGFTADQRRAIEAALNQKGSARPPVNLRLSVPILRWRFYFNILAGKERRSPARLRLDRAHHPLHTAGNFLFILAGAMGFYILVLLAFLLNSSVMQY